MELFGYWRSSASYRVRIALNLKGLAYKYTPVNLLEGEQRSEAYRARNPQALVPSLVLEDGATLTQSLAIIEYLEAIQPEPALWPLDEVTRAQARAFVLAIAADTHPLQNQRVLKYVKDELGGGDEGMKRWAMHWIGGGLESLEPRVAGRDTAFVFGDQPGAAECYIVPQVYNARRFGLDMDRFPALEAVDAKCAELDAFKAAHPDNQPDTPA